MVQSRPAAAIVGAGAVAQTFARLLTGAGQPIVALANRTRETAERAAHVIEASGRADSPKAVVRVVTYDELPRIASRIIVAVADRAINSVAEALAAAGMRSGVVLHTCGARGPEALAPLRAAGVACGMLHPLQTIMTPTSIDTLRGVTFGVTGDAEAVEWAEQLVASLGGRILLINSDRVSCYHAGAVMASNALIAVLEAAVVLLTRADVEPRAALEAIGPLARTSVNNAVINGPHAALTGPVARGDATTVAAHMRALREVEPSIAALYRAAAGRLVHLARERGVPDARLREVESVLESSRSL